MMAAMTSFRADSCCVDLRRQVLQPGE